MLLVSWNKTGVNESVWLWGMYEIVWNQAYNTLKANETITL